MEKMLAFNKQQSARYVLAEIFSFIRPDLPGKKTKFQHGRLYIFIRIPKQLKGLELNPSP